MHSATVAGLGRRKRGRRDGKRIGELGPKIRAAKVERRRHAPTAGTCL